MESVLTKDEIKDNVNKWIAELKSGKHSQCKARLAVHDELGYSYCCLGVASKFVAEYKSTEERERDVATVSRDPKADRSILLFDFGCGSSFSTLNSFEDFGLLTSDGGFFKSNEDSPIFESDAVNKWYALISEDLEEFFPRVPKNRGVSSLAQLNDDGATFAELARFMVDRPHLMFSDPYFYPEDK
jgi:hypothetical protein